MRTGTAKDALSKLRWKERVDDWSDVRITIRHHGAPKDEKLVVGSRVTRLMTSFFEIDHETQIPFHRILRIERGADVLYERKLSSTNA